LESKPYQLTACRRTGVPQALTICDPEVWRYGAAQLVAVGVFVAVGSTVVVAAGVRLDVGCAVAVVLTLAVAVAVVTVAVAVAVVVGGVGVATAVARARAALRAVGGRVTTSGLRPPGCEAAGGSIPPTSAGTRMALPRPRCEGPIASPPAGQRGAVRLFGDHKRSRRRM
jgi:hypothetical protein